MGDPFLFQQSKPVDEFNSDSLNQLITDMWDSMRSENGAGLAAPQIGIDKQVVIFGFESNPRYPDVPPIPQTILINPQITPLSNEKEEDWEGCLSLPGMRGLVPRYRHVRYTGFDEKGNPVNRDVEGFHARVVQHECDHLNGLLYPQRITNIQSFGFREELEKSGQLKIQPCDD